MTDYWTPLAKEYDPLKCGSIDGVGTDVHDNGILRAQVASYHPNKCVIGDQFCTLFVGKLNHKTDQKTLEKVFSYYGKIKRLRLVRDLVTGYSKGYAFIEFEDSNQMEKAYKEAHGCEIDGCSILVDFEHERNLKGWIPRRLGGGFGGKKESGQLRFGGRARPFKRPIIKHSSHPSNQRDSRQGSRYKNDSRFKSSYSKGSFPRHHKV